MKALRSREEQLWAIFEGAGIGIAQTSLDGRVIRTNPKLPEMLGYSEQELQNRELIEFTHPIITIVLIMLVRFRERD